MTEPTDEELYRIWLETEGIADALRAIYQASVASQAARIAELEKRQLTQYVADSVRELDLIEASLRGSGLHGSTVSGRVTDLIKERIRLVDQRDAQRTKAQNAEAERDTLARRVAELEGERDKAQENYQFMVDRAANEKLDGYRALAQRCATLETERDTLTRDLAEEREAVRALLSGCLPAEDDTTSLAELAAKVDTLTRELAEERERSDQRQKGRLVAEMPLCDRERELAEARDELRLLGEIERFVRRQPACKHEMYEELRALDAHAFDAAASWLEAHSQQAASQAPQGGVAKRNKHIGSPLDAGHMAETGHVASSPEECSDCLREQLATVTRERDEALERERIEDINADHIWKLVDRFGGSAENLVAHVRRAVDLANKSDTLTRELAEAKAALDFEHDCLEAERRNVGTLSVALAEAKAQLERVLELEEEILDLRGKLVALQDTCGRIAVYHETEHALAIAAEQELAEAREELRLHRNLEWFVRDYGSVRYSESLKALDAHRAKTSDPTVSPAKAESGAGEQASGTTATVGGRATNHERR